MTPKVISPSGINARSRKIDSEEKLINYIRTQLGEPLIIVDVTDEQIQQAIDTAFQKFSLWALDAQQEQVFTIKTQAGIYEYLLDEKVRNIYDISIADTTSGYANTNSGISLGSFGSIPIGYIPYIDPTTGAASHLETYSGNGSTSGVAGAVAGSSNRLNSGAMNTAYVSYVNAQTLQNLFSRSISFDFNAMTHILRLFQDLDGAQIAILANIEYIPNPEFDDAYGHPWIKEYSLALTKFIWGNNVGKYSKSLVGGAEINYDRLISEANEQIDKLEQELLDKYSEPLGIFSG